MNAEERRARVARGRRKLEEADKQRGKLGILVNGAYVFWNPAHTGYCFCRIEHGVETEIAECIPKTALDPYARIVFVREGPALVAVDPNSLDAVNIYGEAAPALTVASQPMSNRGSGDWTPTEDNLPLGNGTQFNSTPFTDAFETLVGYLRTGQSVAHAIASGTLTIGEEAVVVVSAQTGTSDTLDDLAVTGAPRLILLMAASGHTITVSNTGNLFTFSGDPLDFTDMQAVLLYWDGMDGFITAGGSSGGVTHPITLETSSTLTVASGAVTVTKDSHSIDTESAAASDDLDTINGGSTGQFLILRAANSSHTVVVKNGSGNIQLSGGADYSLDNTTLQLLLVYNGTDWTDVSPPPSSAGGAPDNAAYVTTQSNGSLSNEIVRPELQDLVTGSEIDMSGASTGTGVTASLSDDLYHITWTNNSYQQWDVSSAIGTGDFDVRIPIYDSAVSINANNSDPLLHLVLWDSSRTFSTALMVQYTGAAPAGGNVPKTAGLINGSVQGRQFFTMMAEPPLWLRISRSGTTVTFWFSQNNGRFWVKLGTATSSLNIAKIGLALHANTQTQCEAIVGQPRS